MQFPYWLELPTNASPKLQACCDKQPEILSLCGSCVGWYLPSGHVLHAPNTVALPTKYCPALHCSCAVQVAFRCPSVALFAISAAELTLPTPSGWYSPKGHASHNPEPALPSGTNRVPALHTAICLHDGSWCGSSVSWYCPPGHAGHVAPVICICSGGQGGEGG